MIYNKSEKVLFEVDDAYDEEKIKRLFRREFFLILPNCKYVMKVIIWFLLYLEILWGIFRLFNLYAPGNPGVDWPLSDRVDQTFSPFCNSVTCF